MTDTEAIAAAAALVEAAGFTPCPFSSFVHNGKAFAFSSECHNGFSAFGPAFEVVVDVATGETVH